MKRFIDMSHQAVFEVWLIFKWYNRQALTSNTVETNNVAFGFSLYNKLLRNGSQNYVISRSLFHVLAGQCVGTFRHWRYSRRRLNDVSSSRAVKLSEHLSARTASRPWYGRSFDGFRRATHSRALGEPRRSSGSIDCGASWTSFISPSFFFLSGLGGM